MDSRDQQFLERLSAVTEAAQPYEAEGPLNAPEWDSLVVLSVISLIDEVYGVTVPAKELMAATSVPRLLALIRSAEA